VIPSAGTQVLSSPGQTAQFKAFAIYQMGSSDPTSHDVTNSVAWSANNVAVATINSSGLATGVVGGKTVITAELGGMTANSDLTVTGSSGNVAGGSITSISVIPGSQSVSSPNHTSQFIAIGTTSSGATVNLTNQVAWNSSSTPIATIGAATGLATAMAKGTVTITALYSSAGTVVSGTATFTVTSGTTQQFTSVTILPSSQTLSTLGQQAQFIALATSGTTGLQQDMTNSPQLKWSSSVPTAGSISATGLAKNLAAANSTITAELTNSDGSVVSNTATLTTTLTAAPQDLLSLTVIPSSIGLSNLQGTGQFLAIGTFSSPPYVRDLTNTATWITSAPNVFPVTTNNSAAPTSGSQNGGVASAWGNGSAAIIAEARGTDGSIQTATATFSCPLVEPNPAATPPVPGSCFQGSQAAALLSTLTVYNEGVNTNTTTTWQVTAPSATGTPNVLHCGPGYTGTGGSVCTATYPVGATVILKAAGGAFGGWSHNCKLSDQNGNTVSPPPITAAGPNYCVVSLTSDDTVGAIFN
jgi:hypothetical protein